MAKTTDGELYVEPLTADDIEKIRSVSRSRDKGPWVDWWEEMAKKSALRRLAKRLPNSSDLDDLLRRDDELYDLHGASDRIAKGPRPRLEVALDELARPLPAALDLRTNDAVETDRQGSDETDPIGEDDHAPEAKRGASGSKPVRTTNGAGDVQATANQEQQSSEREPALELGSQPGDGVLRDGPRQSAEDVAYNRGRQDREKGLSRRAVPGEYRQEGHEAEAQAWQKGFDQVAGNGGAK
jgi:recombination protein RecT